MMKTLESRKTIMRQYANEMRRPYDYILIDTMSSLGMMTINALVEAEEIYAYCVSLCFTNF